MQADPQTGRLLLVNKGVSDITGFTEAELLKLTYLDITHPDDRAENKQRFESMMMPGASGWHTYLRRLLRKDGEVRWVSVNAAVSQRDADGKPLRTAAVLIDVTDRIRAETAERDTAAKLADQSRVVDRVLSSIDDFVYTFDLNGRFTYANKPLLENSGSDLGTGHRPVGLRTQLFARPGDHVVPADPKRYRHRHKSGRRNAQCQRRWKTWYSIHFHARI